MTDDKKLALLTRFEDMTWEMLQQEDNPKPEWFDIIERCQRIRAGLTKPVFTVANPGVYTRSNSGDEGF